jgi:hypothetical protein
MSDRAWLDGYNAGFDDADSCEHRFGRTSRILWKISGHRLMAPWDKGDCHAYRTKSPYDTEDES